MRKISFVLIVAAGILWGTSSLFVNFLSPHGFSSLQMTFIRSIVSLIVMFIYVFLKNKRLFNAKPKELLMFAGSGISFFCTASFYYISMQMTTVSTAVVLMYTAPIFVMIYSVFFLGEKLTVLKSVSVVSMLVGCFLVSGIVGNMKNDTIGIIIGLMSGVSYSAYNIFTKMQMRMGSNPITATLYCFLFATVATVFLCKPESMPGLIAKNPAEVIPLAVGLGLCTCVAPYFLYTLSLKELPVGTATALGVIEPMSATVFSVAILGEHLDILPLWGIILILASVFSLGKSEE